MTGASGYWGPTISVAGGIVSTVSHEGAVRIPVESNSLECECLLKGGKTILVVHGGDQISLK